jgi:uncharacterized membrane protein YjgN (DUF898 family)
MSQYPAPPPPAGYQPRPNHPQATTVLVLGILGIALCNVLGPFAWSMGNRVVREIDASGGALGGRDSANIGRICGIIGTVILVVGLVLVVGIFVFGAALGLGSTTT